MSIPCNFFSPDPSKLAVGKSPLQDANPALLAICPAAPKDGSASFDSVLNKVDDQPSDPADTEAKKQPRSLASGSLTPEQLAMMVSMIMPNPAMVPPPPPVQPDATENPSSLELLGAEGRSIPELLVRGADVLEYQVAPTSQENTAALESSGGPSVLPAGPKTQPLPAPSLANAAPQTLSVRATPQPQSQPEIGSGSMQRSLRAAKAASNRAMDADPSHVSLQALPLFKNAGMLGVRSLRLSDMTTPPLLNSSTLPVQPAAAGPSSAAASTGAATLPGAGSSILPPTAFSNSVATGTPASSSTPDEQPSDDQRNSTPDTTAGEIPQTTAAGIPSTAVAAAAAHDAAANLPRSRINPSERQEKSAGSTASIRSPGGKSPTARGKNVALPADEEGVDKSSDEVGTIAANWGKTMYQETRNFPSASAQSDSSSFGGVLRSDHGITAEDLKQVSPAHATDLVHEIREIADGLWAVERNSVEVKFNFGEQERLSVRVEYRNGTVQATFRTDSSDVRDAIAREWQAQGGLAERPYRVADPVFTTTTQPTSGFSSGGDASRQQRSPEQQPQAISFERLTLGSASRSAATTTVSSLPSSASPRETTGRLHALV